MQELSLTKDTRPFLLRVDVRIKMFLGILAAVFTIALSSVQAQIILFSFSLIYLLTAKKWKLIVISYLLMIAMMLLSWGFANLVGHYFPALGKGMTFTNIIVPFLRGAVMLNIVLPLAFTSKIQAILHGLQSLRLPFVIYLPAAVIIRFIPTFTNDIKQIWESLKLRGYRINPWTMTLHPFEITHLLFAPLLFRSLKTSDELGIAAELKGLSADCKPSFCFESKLAPVDYGLVALAILVCVVAAAAQYVAPDMQWVGIR